VFVGHGRGGEELKRVYSGTRNPEKKKKKIPTNAWRIGVCSSCGGTTGEGGRLSQLVMK